MTKDWEYDFLELLRVYDGKIPDDLVIFVRALLAKHLSRAVAKERTQLLKEVREKVIGEDEKLLGGQEETVENMIKASKLGYRRQLRKEQLKKLKELEEDK